MLSVIIPTYKEAGRIAGTVAHVREVFGDRAEIIVVDSSPDGATRAAAEGADVVIGTDAPSRGAQMNLGAEAAAREILLFLHADSRLPEDAGAFLAACAKDPAFGYGAFPKRFAPRALALNALAALNNLEARVSGRVLGDNALFLTREAFDAVGGFPNVPLMEDVGMSLRLKRWARAHGKRFRLAPSKTVTSSRRFRAYGTGRALVLMMRLQIMHRLGASPDALYEAYYGRRQKDDK